MKKSIAIILSIMLIMAITFTVIKVISSSNKKISADVAVTNIKNPVDFYKKYNPSITLTEGTRVINPVQDFPAGDDIDNNELTRWSKDNIGIVWKAPFTAPSDDAVSNKLILEMASNNLPDVIHASNASTIAKLAASGQIIPLNDYMENWMSPITKYAYEQYNLAFGGKFYAPFTQNGKIYAIPRTNDNVAPTFPWYRKDILDNLGLGIPQTIAQYEEMLKAYHEKYPNGVGLITDKSLNYGFRMIQQAYGAFSQMWYEDDKGKVVYGSVQPQMKKALETLSRWYKAGYLDKEFVLKDQVKSAEPIASGDFMSFEGDWYNAAYLYNPMGALKNVPSMVMYPGPYLKGPDGKAAARQYNDNSWGTAISAKCKNPEAVFVFLNWQVESTFRNDTNLTSKFKFMKYKPEDPMLPTNQADIDAAVKAGETAPRPTYNYKQTGPGNANGFFNTAFTTARDYFGIIMIQTNNELRDSFIRLKTAYETGNQTGLTVADKIYNANFMNKNDMMLKNHYAAIGLAVAQQSLIKLKAFSGAPTLTMVDKQAYLSKLESETFTKIIIGEAPIGEFDNFVATWKSSGGDQITKEVNEWSESVK